MVHARDLLGRSGPLACHFSGYEDRPGQLAMADAVERALGEDRILICEAGTGTGKTLAYLVPALLSGRKVVVSTATRALQEQIDDKDLPLIRDVLGIEARTAVMKGLGNYLCLRRYHAFRSSPNAIDPLLADRIATIDLWAGATLTGDIAEIEGLIEDDPLWRDVSSSSETRIGSGCARYEECFVTRIKERATRAQLVIVNHHLFFADLALRGAHSGGALPPYDAVIFDEAHQLEDIATEFFGVRVSSARVGTLVRDAEHALTAAGLLLARARRRRAQEQEPFTRPSMLEVLQESAARFFGEVVRARPSAAEGKAELGRDAFSGGMLSAYYKLDTAAEVLEAYAAGNSVSEEMELVARRAKQLREDLATIVDGAKNQVTWAEGRSRSVSIGASPIELANLLKTRLFDQVPAVVLTSATLATNHGFSFLRSRIGLDGDERIVDELEVPSPFDYESRALLYVPRDLPEPTSPMWLQAATERVRRLVEASRGGAFVLATSKRVMMAIHAALAKDGGRLVLVQGEAPKAMLLSRFREAEDAVLVATMSFWEGVDVPGRALRLVILDKIPFAVPSDPLVVARSAALAEAGKNPFVEYQVPAAAISLKQGFGRLVRTRRDAGIVAILDTRLHSRGYGRQLLAGLPPARRTDVLEEALQFAERL